MRPLILLITSASLALSGCDALSEGCSSESTFSFSDGFNTFVSECLFIAQDVDVVAFQFRSLGVEDGSFGGAGGFNRSDPVAGAHITLVAPEEGRTYDLVDDRDEVTFFLAGPRGGLATFSWPDVEVGTLTLDVADGSRLSGSFSFTTRPDDPNPISGVFDVRL
ncbi:MAG: hypothetical protein AAF170_00130 [Bacteroidota bacterium]